MCISFIVTAGILTVNSVRDIRKREIYLFPTVVIAAVGIVFQVLYSGTALGVVIMSFIPGICAGAFSLLSKGQMGMGDALVILCIGIWRGADETFFVCVAGMLTAAVAGIILYAAKKTMKELPLVPFLLAAEVLAVLRNV